jgi:N-acetylglutamate synthase/N-acetylornithine aminotransferase
MLDNVAKVKETMQRASLAPAARSIMTTDRYPKLRGCSVGKNGARVVGIAKGAGMVRSTVSLLDLQHVFTCSLFCTLSILFVAQMHHRIASVQRE